MIVLFLLLALLQTADGAIHLITRTPSGGIASGVPLAFYPEGAVEPLGACRSDKFGRCTIFVTGAPTDAAGLIRGTLRNELGDSRPVIWPGGAVEIIVVVDIMGRMAPPVDRLATHAPTPEGAATLYPLMTLVAATLTARPSETAPEAASLTALPSASAMPVATAKPIPATPQVTASLGPTGPEAVPLGPPPVALWLAVGALALLAGLWFVLRRRP